jgi:hypothetical protein
MQRLCAMVLAVACVAIYSWFCTSGDPRSDFAHGAPGNVSARLRLRLITGLDRSCNRLLAKSFPGEVLGH